MKVKYRIIPKVIALAVIFTFICDVCLYDIPSVHAEGKEASAAQSADAPASAQDELVVVYEGTENQSSDEAAKTVKEAVEGEVNVQDVEPVTDSVGNEGPSVLVTLEDGDDLNEAKKYLEEQDGVAYVQPNFRYRMMDAVQINDEYAENLYHLNPWDDEHKSQCGANVKGAWEIVGGLNSPDDFDAADVTLAVLDSGCQTSHEDLMDAVDMEHAYDAVRQLQGAEYVADQSGHGTHVAGIAAGIANNGRGIAGAAGNHARILPVNVFTGKWARTTDMLTAFSYLEELMDSGEVSNLHVINMSLGGYGETDDEDEALKADIARMRDKDVLTVCAGGNGDEETGFAYKDNPCFPGDFDECLCVTSLDSDGTNSVFSDYNMYKDISAPGSFILSTMIDETGTIGDENDKKYGFLSGTSMASPLVAGIAALMWADNPELTADQVFESIINTANEVNNAVYSHVGETGSAGAIDAAEAIKYAREHFDQARTKLTEDDIQLDTDEFVYDGTAKVPSVTVTHDGETLTEGTDYMVSFSDNVNAGQAYVSVTGIKNYIGTVHKNYEIARADISDAEITLEPAEFDFDGSYHFPSKIKVNMDGKSLKWGQDFNVTALTDCTSKGTHQIELAGKGNYGGTVVVEYSIKSDDDEGGESGDPGDNPGDNPSDNPGDNPSENPGDDPSDNPGDNPSDNPSDNPGDNPSDNPGDNPSDKPSDGSNDKPSDGDETKPSDGPEDQNQDGSTGDKSEDEDSSLKPSGETDDKSEDASSDSTGDEADDKKGSQDDKNAEHQDGSSDGKPDGSTDGKPDGSSDGKDSGDEGDVVNPDNSSGNGSGSKTIEPPEAPWSETEILEAKLRKVKGLKLKVKGRKFRLRWKKTKGASGYQIKYRLKGKKKWKTLKKSTTKSRFKTRKLKKGRKYQFRVRAYTEIGGQKYYGKWSKSRTKRCR